jgi:hypothetical protein
MAEPTSTTLATLAAAGASLPLITIMGIPLGLRADLLVAGFAGALVAVTLLNSVPSTEDTWRALVRVTLRRMMFVFASSLTAGYMAPLALVIASLPDAVLLSGTFGVGAGAQQVLVFAIKRLSGGAQGGAT